MTHKKKGNFLLEELRMTHLMEADFNLLTGIIFRQKAMCKARERQLIHEVQHVQPGSKCTDASFLKMLFTQMAHLSKTNMGQFDSNAAACFDGTVMPLALVGFGTLGVTSLALTM